MPVPNTPSNTIARTRCGSSWIPDEIDVPIASGSDNSVAITS